MRRNICAADNGLIVDENEHGAVGVVPILQHLQSQGMYF